MSTENDALKKDFVECMKEVARLLGVEALQVPESAVSIKVKNRKPHEVVTGTNTTDQVNGRVEIEYRIPTGLKDKFNQFRVQRISLEEETKAGDGEYRELVGTVYTVRAHLRSVKQSDKGPLLHAVQGYDEFGAAHCKAFASGKTEVLMDARNTRAAYELVRDFALKHGIKQGSTFEM